MNLVDNDLSSHYLPYCIDFSFMNEKMTLVDERKDGS